MTFRLRHAWQSFYQQEDRRIRRGLGTYDTHDTYANIYARARARRKRKIPHSHTHEQSSRSKQINALHVLGLAPGATPDQIVQAWEHRHQLFNPDKVQAAADEETKEWACKNLKAVNDALFVLTAPKPVTTSKRRFRL
jgi:hypothetical protein